MRAVIVVFAVLAGPRRPPVLAVPVVLAAALSGFAEIATAAIISRT